MKKINLLQILLFVLVSVISSALFAQDVFRSAGTTSTKSYRYIEVQYQFDTNLDNPYTLTAYYSIASNIALRFSYFKQSAQFIGATSGLPISAALENILFGAVYYRPFTYLEGADWIVGLDIGRETLDARVQNTDVKSSDSDNIQQLYVGLRKSLGPKLEIQGGFNAVFGSDIENERFDLLAIYRIGEFLDAALGITDVSDGDTVGLGLRYTW